MKNVIFSFIPATETSMVASTKVARFVRDQLQIPLIWDDSIGEELELNNLLIVNGAYAFCKHLQPLSYAIQRAKRIVWIQQDYSIVPPINDGNATSPFRRAFVERRMCGMSHLDYWTTCENESKETPYSHYVNWNCLSMQEMKNVPLKNDQLVYYGSYRQGRTRYFNTFFDVPKYEVVISSPSKEFKKNYQDPKITHCGPPEDLIDWLSYFGMGLYLEDRKSHSEFHSPPNRFYEMLSAGLPMVFQQEAGYTLRKAGYKDIDRYTVTGASAVARKLEAREVIGNEQKEAWYEHAMEERAFLPDQLKQAWSKLNDT
jgi:hypothetical protein